MLAGKDGSLTYSVDNMGNVNPASSTVTDPARNGGTVRLTIDQSLQYTAQQYLDTAVRESGARGAEMVVLDAHTAQVLAMASSGTFDAANPNTINPNVPMNPPVMSAFEPGSVQKSITFAAALQQKLIKPNTVISVPTTINMGGVTRQRRLVPPDRAVHRDRRARRVVQRRHAEDRAASSARPCGTGTSRSSASAQKTGIELPGESSGYLPPMSQWSGSTFANLPFGQGESMTVLQLASIYQTIANNGVRVPPRIVQSVTVRRRRGRRRPASRPASRVITPQTAQTLRTMLESVTLPGGTGTKAADPRLPRRRQDRHRAAARPEPRRRVLQLDELGHLRRA